LEVEDDVLVRLRVLIESFAGVAFPAPFPVMFVGLGTKASCPDMCVYGCPDGVDSHCPGLIHPRDHRL
jgi:hypothetical protein